MMFSKEIEMSMALVVAKAALFGLYEQYAQKGHFNMDRYVSAENNIEKVLAHLQKREPRIIQSNPCAEILMRSTRPDND